MTNGAVGATTGADNTSEGIESYGNGWYRCWIVFTSDGTDTIGTLRIRPANADNNHSVARDGTSSIYVWGAQLEAGAFPSSYIATTTASVTRNKDSVVTTDASWFSNSAPGSWYSKSNKTYLDANNQGYVWCLGAGATARWWFLAHTGGGGTQSRDQVSPSVGDSGLVTGLSTYAAGVDALAAVALDTDDLQAYHNGTATAQDTTVDLPSDVTRLNVGSLVNDSSQFNGHIAEIRYYNTRLTNAQLEDMSNGVFPSFDRGLTRQLTRGLTRDLTRLLAG